MQRTASHQQSLSPMVHNSNKKKITYLNNYLPVANLNSIANQRKRTRNIGAKCGLLCCLLVSLFAVPRTRLDAPLLHIDTIWVPAKSRPIPEPTFSVGRYRTEMCVRDCDCILCPPADNAATATPLTARVWSVCSASKMSAPFPCQMVARFRPFPVSPLRLFSSDCHGFKFNIIR